MPATQGERERLEEQKRKERIEFLRAMQERIEVWAKNQPKGQPLVFYIAQKGPYGNDNAVLMGIPQADYNRDPLYHFANPHKTEGPMIIELSAAAVISKAEQLGVKESNFVIWRHTWTPRWDKVQDEHMIVTMKDKNNG